MVKMVLVGIIFVGLLVLPLGNLIFAGEVDVLIKKLVEKKILNEDEAKQILTETKETVKKEIEKGDSLIPKWAVYTKVSGDLRLRFESCDRANTSDRTRANVRLRYGIESKINDQMTVGVRLASGSSASQVSREQSLSDSFNSKSIWLDLAYLEYAINKKITVIGGKMKNPFYLTHDIIWSTNLTPEGAVFKYKTAAFNKKYDLFANIGMLPLDQDTNVSPIMYAYQSGFSTKVLKRPFTSAITFYDVQDIKDATYANITPSQSKQSNTLTGGRFQFEYRIFDASLEYSPLDVSVLGTKMPLTLMGSYIRNIASGVDKDDAWISGFQLGKAKDKGNWDVSYNYRKIEADATLDFINDSTFHGGGTNSKGHKVCLRYIPLKNTDLTLSYFNTDRVSGLKTTNDYLDTLQLDFTTKF